jgi:hypothetical protein
MVIHGTRTIALSIPARELDDLCQEWHVQRLAVFGSVTRGDFSASSDVDILVEFQPGWVPGLGFFALQEALSNLLERRVDLNTPGFLGRHIRDDVLREAVEVYAAT